MALFTKLDAVNQILSGIGESPVSSLSSGLPDAETAERFLDEISMDVQESGWQCNTDTNLKLYPNAEGNIALPINVLKVDSSGTDARRDVVEREGKLYDRDNKTFIFTSPITVDIVFQLAFEDLPYRFRKYVAAKTARIYQERTEGSVALDSFLRKEEEDCKAKWLDTEADNDDLNVLSSSQSVVEITRRNAPRRY